MKNEKNSFENIDDSGFELKILIVEDSLIELKMMEAVLKAAGYGFVEKASNKREALEKIYLYKPDIVLMDISLDEAEAGVEVAGLIKNDTNISTAVVYITSHSHSGVFKKAKATNPYGYIIKPYTKESLCVAIEMAYNRRRLEEKLKESAQVFKTSVETMLDCFGIYSALRNEKGEIIDFIVEYVNESACICNRLAVDRQIGRKLCEILPAHKENGLFEALCQVVEKRTPLIKQAFKVYNASIGEGCRYFDIRAVPLKDGFAAAWRDVSEGKKAQEALMRSEEKYREIVENINEGFWLVDNNFNTVFMNKKMHEIIGYSFDELVSTSIINYICDDQLAVFHKNIENLKAGVKNNFSLFLKHKNGRGIYVKTSLCEFRDNSGKVNGLFAFFNSDASVVNISGGLPAGNDDSTFSSGSGLLIGNSKFINDFYAILPSIAESNCNVLIEGASGSGKSLIARAIHQASERRDFPFVVVNCGALPDTLIESELFGYVKGAFTDAKKDKPGKFAVASGGTIFLDEIGEMPLHLQVKTLHVIEEKVFEALGSNESQKADVRIIAATNKNLVELIEEKKFREDLYYRLKIVNVKVPSLKERKEDILLLAQYFIKKLNRKYGKNINGISDNLMKFLLFYNFPGNVRELFNIFEHAFVFSNNSIIDIEQLSDEYLEIYKKNVTCVTKNAVTKKEVVNEPYIESVPGSECDDECGKLLKALDLFDNNRNKAAEFLGISRMALWRRMKKHGLLNVR